ncbi:hypothetical protein [Erwinia sp. JUb26]|uniref:hypothetical protein n=1 Tax=Erwinia sp. JUb26 TaxID=2485126 RepID=UPI0013156178|nr:hypothetical protein [Erwinia sp. JUb26]
MSRAGLVQRLAKKCADKVEARLREIRNSHLAVPHFIMPLFAAVRQTSKTIQHDPGHAAINFTDQNNWQLKYQTLEGKSNLQDGKSLTDSTKKHPIGCFFEQITVLTITAAALFR